MWSAYTSERRDKTANMKSILTLTDVSSGYGSGCTITGISFTVKTGQVAALLGSNGSGKTTLLKTIMGLMGEGAAGQHETGSIEFLGKRIDRLETNEIVRMGMSYVPQGRELFPELTVGENLTMGACARRDGREEDREIVYRHFPVLRERRLQKAGHLSGGEQQVLAIGRAMVSRPHLILLDEPSVGLSPIAARGLFESIRTINREQAVTFLVVEQNVQLALGCADYVFLLAHGTLVREGQPETFLEDAIKNTYLGIP